MLASGLVVPKQIFSPVFGSWHVCSGLCSSVGLGVTLLGKQIPNSMHAKDADWLMLGVFGLWQTG